MSRRFEPAARLLASLAVIAGVWFLSPAAGAQTAETADPPELSTAIGVPFIGSYDVWCTSRNPAPGTLCRNHHSTPAIDFGMDPGTEVRASGGGVVVDADSMCVGTGWCNGGAGNKVVIEHSDGTFSRYLHLTDVFVAVDQVVEIGALVGTSGVTGQSSSPHLHYDEQFPIGTRIPFGQWIGCVDDEPVVYPDVFGTTDWNLVEFGSVVRNDGYDCLRTTFGAGPAARVLAGQGSIGVVVEDDPMPPELYEAEFRVDDGEPEVVLFAATGLVRHEVGDAAMVTVRVRRVGGDVVQPWGAPTLQALEDRPLLATCDRLYVTADGLIGTDRADVLVGTEAADQMRGGAGPDVLCGLDGDDDIDAGGDDDMVIAGDGDDAVNGGDGHDRLFGGDGDDEIAAGAGRDRVLAGNGADRVFGEHGHDRIFGGAGDDEIFGGDGRDRISGDDGHDILRGEGGADRIFGRDGRDVLLGGPSDDHLSGGARQDQLFGEVGNDRLIGGNAIDTFDGGEGIDRCSIHVESEPRENCE